MIEIPFKLETDSDNVFPPHGVEFYSTRITNWRLNIKSNAWHPPTDYYETSNSIYVSVEIPGMIKENFSLSYDNQILSIAGVRIPPKGKRSYHQMEIKYGEFCSHVKLPVNINIENIEATYHDGFLNIEIPKLRATYIDINKD